MARVKPKRHNVIVDMTAMCDVGFLLLTFFILTAQFKKPDTEAIVTPSSISTQKLDETNLMTINVTPDGRYFFSPIENSAGKAELLDKMAAKYKVSFTPAEKRAFVNSSVFGASMSQLKAYLNLPPAERDKVKGATIPLDDTHKELIDWVKYSLEVNPNARLAIKGDATAEYPKFKALFDGLRDIEFYKFILITTAE
ncbi:biopolymer transporter ExbD [Elizabethkingia sp. JS20170427COW]|uniref:ExbD/TolR family protein n=1 Tax=Elizabethkingia sp. JS20170427COW TaxID=2583851 RepID=UPI001110A479|nr:biopolymer transporter ExbD [Elizabethkingia sp. JS20170427COW]QCX53394.1 biopolymer transporter ExbD [Elizabethkingia sp. JS20170427COW]